MPERPNTQQVVERLTRLERQNRWLRLGALCGATALLLLIGGFVLGRTDVSVVHAQAFVLRDEDGRNHGALRLDSSTGQPELWLKGSPTIVFYDDKDRVIWKAP